MFGTTEFICILSGELDQLSFSSRHGLYLLYIG